MGCVCSKKTEKKHPRDVKENDIDYILRTKSIDKKLSGIETEKKITEALHNAIESYHAELNQLFITEKAIMTASQFSRHMQVSLDGAAHQFKKSFLDSKVPYQEIFKEIPTLTEVCQSSVPIYKYYNEFNSFMLCKEIKQNLVEKDLIQQKKLKKKITDSYNALAKGSFAEMIRRELEEIIDNFYLDENSENALMLMQAQAIGNRMYLKGERSEAEALRKNLQRENPFSKSIILQPIAAVKDNKQIRESSVEKDIIIEEDLQHKQEETPKRHSVKKNHHTEVEDKDMKIEQNEEDGKEIYADNRLKKQSKSELDAQEEQKETNQRESRKNQEEDKNQKRNSNSNSKGKKKLGDKTAKFLDDIKNRIKERQLNPSQSKDLIRKAIEDRFAEIHTPSIRKKKFTGDIQQITDRNQRSETTNNDGT